MHHHTSSSTLIDLAIGISYGIIGFIIEIVTSGVWDDFGKTAFHALIAAVVGATLTFFINKFWKWLWIKIFKK